MARTGKGSSIGRTAIWILMGLLILGLGGFGAVNLSGNVRNIGTVGDLNLPVDQYARELNQEIRAIESQTGQQFTFAQAQEIGLDRAVLQRLVRNRALDNETAQLGLSIGDGALRDQILEIPAFQGVDGSFDRESYRYALQQAGLGETEFETSLREEAARTLLQGAILGGVEMPEAYASTLVSYVGETRSFTWASLTDETLETPLPAPTDAELQAYYDANAEAFMLPAAKRITYALLSPDAMIDTVEVPEEELQREYEARSDQYDQPERRLVERLAFANQEAADQAAAALEVQGTTFDALVEERGLALADVDLGDVAQGDLDGAGEAVFAGEVGEVVGPLPSSLGPALFRVNGVLPAQSVPFEEARPELEAELARTRAVRAVEARARDIDDQLAGGATLEQLAEETEMTLGDITWTEDSTQGIAAYKDFRAAAAELDEGDFPRVVQLDDGGIFAMRLEEALPARPKPFEEAQQDVRAAWTAEKTIETLTARATNLVATLGDDGAFEEAGLTPRIEEGHTRDAFIEGAPEGMITEVFALEAAGDVAIVPGAGQVAVVRLDAITPAADNDENEALLAQLSEQLSEDLARDLFSIYADEVVRGAQPQIDQRAVQAVHVNFN
jgi:peptidyl-prolyl cis-trans isomerase D